MNTTQTVIMLTYMQAVHYIKYFNLIKNFLDIINNKYYLNTCAKYHSSIMADVCTMYPVDLVGLPVKVVWPTAFFLKKKVIFCMAFVLATGQLTWESACEVCLKYNI